MTPIKKTAVILCLLFLTFLTADTVLKGTYTKGVISGTAAGPPPAPPVTDSIGAEWNTTGYPIGGGAGYGDSISSDGLSNNHTSSWIVGTGGTPEDSLIAFLAAAGSDDTVYISDNLEINRTGDTYMNVQAGTILASGRGRTLGDTISWGALVYSTNYAEAVQTFVLQDGARVTGLRIRGGASELEGLQVESDSLLYGVSTTPFFITDGKDGCEIDNCEIWGFGGTVFLASGGLGTSVHHNWFHHGDHIYKGYGVNFTGANTTYETEGNYSDYLGWQQMMDGGAAAEGTHGTNSFNIYGPHSQASQVYYHSDGDSNSCDTLINCSFYNTGYMSANANVAGGYPARDSLLFSNCWFWDDSSGSIDMESGLLFSAVDNQYSTTPPEGVSALLPVAAIVADQSSGNPPLTVKFTATGSTGGAGGVKAFYWDFGDSCGTDNRARVSTHNDTVSHTYTEIGKYYVELMVTDSMGIPDWAYQEIDVQPASGEWFSAWVHNRWYLNKPGYYKSQILLDDWVIWEDDLAGNNAWEHVIVDVSDTFAIKEDSITITFRLLCTRDTSSLWQVWSYIDDIAVYGGTVLNGNFETGTWIGNAYGRTDGSWVGSYSGSNFWVQDGNLLCRGLRAYLLCRGFNPHTSGNYGQVIQRIGVD